MLFVLAVTTILWLPLGKSFSSLGEISIQKAKVPEESKEQPSETGSKRSGYSPGTFLCKSYRFFSVPTSR